MQALMIVGGVAVVVLLSVLIHSCQQAERNAFIECFKWRAGYGQTLYSGGEQYDGMIDYDTARAAARYCYDS